MAKYLINLDPNSAHYDPKTRSMHANPYEASENEPSAYAWPFISLYPDPFTSTANYAGDSFIRYSGEVPKFAETQMFAWEASNRGTDVSALVWPLVQ